MAKGHVGGTLLMPAADETNAVAGAVHGIEKVIQLPARQSIDGVHAMGEHLGQ